jgi:glycosyltransferase involved in cell wall biosynthesis
MPMMKIALIADCIDTQNAGIHVYTRNMIEALERSGKFEVICIRIKNNPEIIFKNQLVVPTVIPFLQKDPLRLFFTLPKAIRRLNPNIVIEPAHFGPFNLPVKIKRVTVIHDLTPIKFPQWHSFLSSNLQKLFLPSIIKKASLIITNSKNTSTDLNEYYPYSQEKTAQIYPAIDPFFLVNKEEIINKKQPFFLSVGTIEPRKNHSLLLDAYQLFREQTNLNFKLIICGGKGWKNSDFYKKLKDHPYKNDIEVKGYVSKEELKELYLTTSTFIYPSLYEGFGFPVAEAMGCGAPCVISNSSSIPEVGGEAAIYFDPKNPEDLATKLTQVISSEELICTLTKKSISQSAQFSWEKFALELEKLLVELK